MSQVHTKLQSSKTARMYDSIEMNGFIVTAKEIFWAAVVKSMLNKIYTYSTITITKSALWHCRKGLISRHQGWHVPAVSAKVLLSQQKHVQLGPIHSQDLLE